MKLKRDLLSPEKEPYNTQKRPSDLAKKSTQANTGIIRRLEHGARRPPWQPLVPDKYTVVEDLA